MAARSHTVSRGRRIYLRPDEQESLAQARKFLAAETGRDQPVFGMKFRPLTWSSQNEFGDRYMYDDEYTALENWLRRQGFIRSRKAAVVGRTARAASGLHGRANREDNPPNAQVWSRGDVDVVVARHESGPEVILAVHHAAAFAAGHWFQALSAASVVLNLANKLINVVKDSIDLKKALRSGDAPLTARAPQRRFVPADIGVEAMLGTHAKQIASVPLACTSQERKAHLESALSAVGDVYKPRSLPPVPYHLKAKPRR